AAVLQFVLEAVRLVGQLPGFAQGDERPFQGQRQGGGEQEPAGLSRRHSVNPLALEVRAHHLDAVLERLGVSQERRNVLEEDARLRKIWYIADVVCEVHEPFLSPRGAGKGYGPVGTRATMTFTVRQAGPSDAPLVVEFNRLLAEESEGQALDLALLRPGVDAVLADPVKGLYFLAEDRGRVVGQ